jgi:WD40 repeat protein
MYTSEAGVSQALEVFPFGASAFRIPLPFALGTFAYNPDGKALYAALLAATPRPGLFKIEFDPIRVSPVPGSSAIGATSFAVASLQNKLVISGAQRGFCGILELSLSSGDARNVVKNPDCDVLDPVSKWSALSVSPDGMRATALRHHRLELIDLVRGEVTALEDGLVLAAWSPDGEWLAAVRGGGDETILLDARSLKRRKVLDGVELEWSPDSRYLLGSKRRVACGPEAGTLEIVDIGTGARTEIASSRCRVDRNTTGWISGQIAP